MSYEKSKEVIGQNAQRYIKEQIDFAAENNWEYTPPKSIYDLEELNIKDVKGLTTFEPLKEYPKLKGISFCLTSIPTLNGIDLLQHINWVMFSYKLKIKDIEALGNAQYLRHLDLSNVMNEVPGDLLAKLNNIDSLTLGKHQIASLKVLPENLKTIHLFDGEMTAIPQWNVCKNVREVTIGTRHSKISTLDGFKCFPNVEKIHIYPAKGLKEINYAKNLKSLKSLDINFAPVEDFSPLASLPDLEELRIRQSPIKDLSVLYPKKKMKVLYLEDSKLQTIEGIKENMPNLELLWIFDTKVKDLAPLTGMTSLKELNLCSLNPKSWDFLPTLTGLENIDLFRSPLTDVTLLAQLPSLRVVRLAESAINTETKEFADFSDLIINKHYGVIKFNRFV